jgi:hypothetical protein
MTVFIERWCEIDGLDRIPVAPLVVVPRHELDEIVRQGEPGFGVDDAGPAVADGRDEVGVAVAEHALHGPLGLLSHRTADVVVGGASGEADGEVHEGGVGRGDAERHAADLALERRDEAVGGLGRRRGAGDEVEPAGAPVLERGRPRGSARVLAIGGGEGVHGGEERLRDAEPRVQDVQERRHAVGGAARHGHHGVLRPVVLLVHAHHERGRVLAEARDHHLLRPALQMRRGSLLVRVVPRALHHVVRAVLAPRNLRQVPAPTLGLATVLPDS